MSIEARAQRLAAERFLARTKDYPAELQPHILGAYGKQIAEDLYDDILANDPILREEIDLIARLEEEDHGTPDHDALEDDGLGALGETDFGPTRLAHHDDEASLEDLENQRLEAFHGEYQDWIDGLREDPTVPLADPDLLFSELDAPLQIIRSDFGAERWFEDSTDFQSEDALSLGFVREHRYARAAHRFLTVLRLSGELPDDPEDAVAILVRCEATGGLGRRALHKLLANGWYFADSELGGLGCRVDERVAANLLTDLAEVWTGPYDLYAPEL